MNAEIQPQIMLNGRLLAGAEARISPLGEGFMHGRGLFETIKVLQGRPVFFPDHAGRLRRSAAALTLPWTSPTDELLERCRRAIAANGLIEGNLKIVVFQDVDGVGELILCRQGYYEPKIYARGFRLTLVADGRRPDSISGLKTLNYLGNSAAKRVAQAAGFDDAVFLDPAGFVLEGATCNVFAVKDGTVATPPLDSGILPGIARANVLRLRDVASLQERALTAAQLLDADEVFVTNALLGVMPVARVDERSYNLAQSPVAKAIATAYRAAELTSVRP